MNVKAAMLRAADRQGAAQSKWGGEGEKLETELLFDS